MTIKEVNFIRPFLLILLVFYHSFAPYNGAWKEFAGFQANNLYYWGASFAYSSMLETFVFVSGYVFAFQEVALNKQTTFYQLIRKKTNRLLLPYFVFGIVYIILFNYLVGGGSTLKSSLLEMINGVGHLWFLPMLFWCFIGTWLLHKWNAGFFRCFLLLFIFALCTPSGKGFQIGTAMYYILFFFIGYKSYVYREKIKKTVDNKTIGMLFVVYITSFVLLYKGSAFLNNISFQTGEQTMFSNVSVMGSMRVLKITYSLLGVMLYYFISLWFTSRYHIRDRFKKVGSYCFGVYIFQQFILKLLYYHTSLPIYFGPLLTPWISFLITLATSLALTHLMRMSSYGRKFI